jgi:hypothetical protein
MIPAQESAMVADEAPPVRPRIVTIVGWVWLILGTFRFLNGVLALIVWKVGGIDRLPLFRFQSEGMQVRVAGLETLMSNAVPMFVAQILVAAAVAWTAFELLRLKRWARPALQAIAGLGILLTAGIAVYVYLATANMSGLAGTERDEVRTAGIAAAALISVLGFAFFGITIWLLGRPAVRRAFEKTA